jgi:FkbM family methyltransferase
MIKSWLLKRLSYLSRHGQHLAGHWRLLRWLESQTAAIAKLGLQTVEYGPYRLQVDPADENGRQIFLRGLNREDRVISHLRRLLRPGDAMLDIGANCGAMCFAAAECVGPSGRVIAFEPSPIMGALLEDNVAGNPSAAITVERVAVGAEAGTLAFRAVPERSGYSSLRTANCPAEELHQVEVIALDDWLDRLPQVRLIKLDIEGAELLALRGGGKLIERDRPHLILEVDDAFLRELGGSASELCDLLGEYGYVLERIGAGGSLTRLDQPLLERCNLLATPQPEPESKRAANQAVRELVEQPV